MDKFENSSLVNEFAPVNNTDDMGGTGNTGGPGGMPTESETASVQSSVSAAGYVGEEDDPMRHLLMHFQGSTGAMGGTPEPDAQPEEGKPVPQDMLQRVAANTTDQIEKLTKEETLWQLKSQNLAADGVFSSARSKMLNIAYLMGCLLVHLKKLVIADNENWGDYIKEHLPEMSRRTIDKYMNIANTPGILTHDYLGIDAAEQIIQAIAPIKRMLSKDDPIGDLFKRNGITLDYANMDKRELQYLVKGVLTREKLLKKDIEVDVDITTDFSRIAGSLTSVDMAVMLDRREHDQSPQDYMKDVITRNGVRPNDVSDSQKRKQPIRYINAETVKLKSSIDRLLEEKVDLKKIDKTHLEALRSAVDTLLDRFSN